jgi:hypothetical protein
MMTVGAGLVPARGGKTINMDGQDGQDEGNDERGVMNDE